MHKSFKFLVQSDLSIFPFVTCAFGIIAKKLWSNPLSWRCSLYFLLRVSQFSLLYLCLWSILVWFLYSVRSNFILLCDATQFSQHHLLKMSLPHCLLGERLFSVVLKIIWQYTWGFLSGLLILFHWSV
jgi:hypothetical protein